VSSSLLCARHQQSPCCLNIACFCFIARKLCNVTATSERTKNLMELSSHDDHCARRRPVCLFTAVGKQNWQNSRAKQGSQFKCRGPRGSRLWARLFLYVCISCSVTHTQSGLHAVLGLCGSSGILTECKALHTKLHLSHETSIDEGGRGLSTMKHPPWTCMGRALESRAQERSGAWGGRGEMASKGKMSRGRWLVGEATDQEDSQFALRWSEVSPVKLVCVSFLRRINELLFALDVLINLLAGVGRRTSDVHRAILHVPPRPPPHSSTDG